MWLELRQATRWLVVLGIAGLTIVVLSLAMPMATYIAGLAALPFLPPGTAIEPSGREALLAVTSERGISPSLRISMLSMWYGMVVGVVLASVMREMTVRARFRLLGIQLAVTFVALGLSLVLAAHMLAGTADGQVPGGGLTVSGQMLTYGALFLSTAVWFPSLSRRVMAASRI